jgi:amidase
LYVPARGAGLNIETATTADLNAAFADGTLTSEQLVSAYLKRIEAYDKQGPAINAIITLNKKALDEARQLDAERKSGKVRGPLHGIPVVVKDNYDTVDMPTTAGSQLLEGHMAKQDAFMVKKLREAGGRRDRHRHAQKTRRGRHRPNQVPRLHPPIEGGAVQHRNLCGIQGADR